MIGPDTVRRGVGALRFGGDGRPLRFLMIVVGGWIGARVALLWNDQGGEQLIATRGGQVVAPRGMTEAGSPIAAISGPPRVGHAVVMPERGLASKLVVMLPPRRAVTASVAAEPVRPIEHPVIAAAAALPLRAPQGEAAQPVARMLPVRTRWSGSAWALVRGSGAGGIATPQLGGAQVGARLAYRLDAGGRVVAAGRVAAALGTRQQEAALGLEWQPTRLPIRLVAEQRIGIAHIRGGPAVGLVGGVSAVPLAAGFRVDGYSQAGVVARGRANGYVDGAVVAGRTVMVRDGTRLELGAGAWGAAQRGVSRLDAGPSATLVLPLERQALRIGLQWRERIAGNARPGSGAVLSLGVDW